MEVAKIGTESEQSKNHNIIAFPEIQEMISLIECPVCFEIPFGTRIYQCILGHNLCYSCRIKVNKCPTCKSDINQGRNFLLEKILDATIFKCKNLPCSEILEGSKMELHLICDCESRALWCYEKLNHACIGGSLIPLDEFQSHLIEEHRALEIKNSTKLQFIPIKEWATNDLRDRVWDLSLIRYDDNVFLSNMRINPKSETLFMWISFLGTQTDANKYKYSVNICEKNNEKISIQWDLPVHSHHFGFDELKDKRDLVRHHIQIDNDMYDDDRPILQPDLSDYYYKYTISKG